MAIFFPYPILPSRYSFRYFLIVHYIVQKKIEKKMKKILHIKINVVHLHCKYAKITI
jgi:hypothetical protein